MVLTLVGNKNDLTDNRSISRDEAFMYASSIGGNYFESSTIQNQGVDQVFFSTALGLVRLASSHISSSLKRYESSESISRYSVSEGIDNLEAVHLGISMDGSSGGGSYEPTETGRLETPSWSIDHIAHGDSQPPGWCCY